MRRNVSNISAKQKYPFKLEAKSKFTSLCFLRSSIFISLSWLVSVTEFSIAGNGFACLDSNGSPGTQGKTSVSLVILKTHINSF